MANICDFTLAVVGTINHVKMFENILKNKDRNKRYFMGIEIYDETEPEIKDSYCKKIYYGECRWSAAACFRDMDHSYYNDEYKNDPTTKATCIEKVSQELNLEVEIYGMESGWAFIEYSHIQDGVVLEDTEGYYECPIIGDYNSYEEFMEANKQSHLSKEEFDQAKEDDLEYVDIVEFEFPDSLSVDRFISYIDKIDGFNLHNMLVVDRPKSCDLTDDIAYDYFKAYKNYFDYVYEHLDNVHKVYYKLKDFLEVYFNLDSKIFKYIIDNHDLSKFSPDEFTEYREHFFPVDEINIPDEVKQKSKELFKCACKKHYMRNPHHPEFWHDEDGTKHKMADIYIAEMICDLWAMSIKFNNTPLEYINSNATEFKDIMEGSSYNKLMDALYNIDVNHLMENDNDTIRNEEN